MLVRRTNIFDHCVEVRLHSYFLKKTFSRKMVILVVEQTARRTERERSVTLYIVQYILFKGARSF